MSRNIIGDSGASCLARALSVNSSLTNLDLSRNRIGDSGAASLSQAIAANSCLTCLNLRRNRIGPSGASSLSQAVTGNISFINLDLSGNIAGFRRSLVLAAHPCLRYIWDESDDDDDEEEEEEEEEEVAQSRLRENLAVLAGDNPRSNYFISLFMDRRTSPNF